MNRRQGSNGRTSLLWGAAAIGGFHATVSLHWALGGTWLANTAGAVGDRIQGVGAGPATALLLGAALLKTVVAVGPLVARTWTRVLGGGARKLGIFAGLVLSIYGLVLTSVGLIALTGALGVPADPESLRGHALLWDPLFAVWGVLLLGGLGLDIRVRPRGHRPAVSRPRPACVKENA